jgi:iron complex outermembrane receptor protein
VSYYAQVDWDSELFGKRFRGNIGLRGYDTHTRSTGWIQGDSYAYLGTADVKGHYSGVLPALNTVLELNDNLLLRFSATQNLNRPTLSSLAAEGSASIDDGGNIEASRGNPNLKPFTDSTLDLAVEYYFGKAGILSGGVFQKYLKNFIGTETETDIPYSQTGLPLGAVEGATPTTPDTIVKEFDMPYNVPGTKKLTGVELAAQSKFWFLPAPFDDLGGVVNYTYVDADQAITGISPTSYNATLYYETSIWSVRASLNHRSAYYTGRNSTPDPVNASTRGFEGTNYLDAAASYNLTDKIQFTLDAINLTNEKETEFFGQAHYLYTQTQSGTTYMLGVSYKY